MIFGKKEKNIGIFWGEIMLKYRIKTTRIGYSVCDTCGVETDVSVMLLFSYGSDRDGESFDFCSDICFEEWIRKIYLKLNSQDEEEENL